MARIPMKIPSKTKFAMAVGFGSAIGTLVYPILRGTQVDWVKALFVGVFSFGVVLVIPKRWINGSAMEVKKANLAGPPENNARDVT
jgi:hypothetical protein